MPCWGVYSSRQLKSSHPLCLTSNERCNCSYIMCDHSDTMLLWLTCSSGKHNLQFDSRGQAHDESFLSIFPGHLWTACYPCQKQCFSIDLSVWDPDIAAQMLGQVQCMSKSKADRCWPPRTTHCWSWSANIISRHCTIWTAGLCRCKCTNNISAQWWYKSILSALHLKIRWHWHNVTPWLYAYFRVCTKLTSSP